MVRLVKRFFIVDDDADDQELFVNALLEIDEHFTFQMAYNGEDALHQLRDGLLLPDLLFLDLNMPKMSGKECLSELKKDDTLKEIPVIVYSTSYEKEDMMDALQLGAAYFLQKPNSFNELSRALMKIIFNDWQKK